MLISVGKKVRFKYTGEQGVVTKLLDGGMVNVYLDQSGMEIPVYEEDLTEAVDFLQKPFPLKKKEVLEDKKLPLRVPATPQMQYAILKGEGVQIGFEPSETGSTQGKYSVYLINDTNYEAVCTVKMMLKNRLSQSWDGKTASFSFNRLFDMEHDDLNEAPEMEIQCRWITTEGADETKNKVLKIKPKTFFKSLRLAPLLNRQVHLYQVFDKPDREETKPPKEGLRDFTQRHSKPSWILERQTKIIDLNDVSELADFQHEIDLHIEQLNPGWRSLSNAQILRQQLSAFDNFIEKSIRFAAPRVFVIHGMGEGRLRDEIATRLMKIPEVLTFKNEYHPRYGYGATEVVFQQE